jgi:hypothetical protein
LCSCSQACSFSAVSVFSTQAGEVASSVLGSACSSLLEGFPAIFLRACTKLSAARIGARIL